MSIKPTEQESIALHQLFYAYLKLQELGWHVATFAPTGKQLHLIETGSTGIHPGQRDEHGFWVYDGETYPANPCLYREATKPQPKAKP